MTDIDKAVELARTVVGANAKLEGVAADIAMDLARAVLAMAEVAQAARWHARYARYGVICATCDARGETPGTCECAPHVGTGVYRAGRSVRVEWTRTLAANLAVAGALCEAFDAGYVEGSEWAEGWRPGCGRAWGG